ncbi:ERF family protein [Nonomuraea sp. NPDC050202]|uniref:ERF family protein n=1 Tax=Nonomuraea sp. NPDC050202 TaxID=3155035 RepID=UPI0033C78839
MSLADKAAALARPDQAGQPTEETAERPAPAAPPEELPDVEVEEREGGPEQVPVHVAWTRVMADVRKISKRDKYDGRDTKYWFRGVDRTVNTFGPVVRAHGVLVLPVHVEAAHRDTKTAKGTPMRECTVTVTWMVVGPMGDTLPSTLQSAGEALDTSDKGTAKAQSVALRVLLLTAAMVPTGDPDPDAVHVERGEAPVRKAADYVEEIHDPRTSIPRLKQIKYEITQSRQGGVLVTNEVGEDEPILNMINRIGREREAASGSAPLPSQTTSPRGDNHDH